jgi:hypothetical protein
MSHRTQITLTDDQYALLKRESRRTGVGLAELIRRAIATTYGTAKRKEHDGFAAAFGLWADRTPEELDELRRLRGPGLGYKLLGDDPRRHEHPD